MKAEWRKISDRCKNRGGLAPEKEPSWYKIFKLYFFQTKMKAFIYLKEVKTFRLIYKMQSKAILLKSHFGMGVLL